MSRGCGIAISESQLNAVHLDLARAVALLPGQMREGVGGRPVQHRSVEMESRPMARTVEGLGVRVEVERASQVRAVLREHGQLALVLDHVSAERQLPGSV